MKRSQLKETDFLPYYKQYIDLAPHNSLIEALEFGFEQTLDFFEKLPDDKQNYTYAEGKWTTKEILLHLIDTERVFAYRALTFARSENEILPGYDQDIFVANSRANSIDMSALINEYTTTRAATLALFRSFSKEELTRKGVASGASLSVAAAGFIIGGHEIHHCNVLRAKYL